MSTTCTMVAGCTRPATGKGKYAHGCEECGREAAKAAKSAAATRSSHSRAAALRKGRRLHQLPRDQRALRVVERATGFLYGTWYSTPEALEYQRALGCTIDDLWTRRMITYRDRAIARGEQAEPRYRGLKGNYRMTGATALAMRAEQPKKPPTPVVVDRTGEWETGPRQDCPGCDRPTSCIHKRLRTCVRCANETLRAENAA